MKGGEVLSPWPRPWACLANLFSKEVSCADTGLTSLSEKSVEVRRPLAFAGGLFLFIKFAISSR